MTENQRGKSKLISLKFKDQYKVFKFDEFGRMSEVRFIEIISNKLQLRFLSDLISTSIEEENKNIREVEDIKQQEKEVQNAEKEVSEEESDSEKEKKAAEFKREQYDRFLAMHFNDEYVIELFLKDDKNPQLFDVSKKNDEVFSDIITGIVTKELLVHYFHITKRKDRPSKHAKRSKQRVIGSEIEECSRNTELIKCTAKN